MLERSLGLAGYQGAASSKYRRGEVVPRIAPPNATPRPRQGRGANRREPRAHRWIQNAGSPSLPPSNRPRRGGRARAGPHETQGREERTAARPAAPMAPSVSWHISLNQKDIPRK